MSSAKESQRMIKAVELWPPASFTIPSSRDDTVYTLTGRPRVTGYAEGYGRPLLALPVSFTGQDPDDTEIYLYGAVEVLPVGDAR